MDKTPNPGSDAAIDMGDKRICIRCHRTLSLSEFNCRKPPRTEYKETCNQCRAPLDEHDRFWQKVDKSENGCWEWTAALCFQGNYGVYRHQGKAQRAHRVSWTLHHGSIPEGFEVCHKCDNPRCIRPDHLFLGTHQDNMQDMSRKGRARPPRGENSWSSKLTNKDVARIRRRYKSGKVSQTDLAKEYNLHASQISRIISGRKWKDSFRGQIKPIRPIKNRGTYRKKNEINPIVCCECGCGQEMERYNKHGRPRRFISGHNARIKASVEVEFEQQNLFLLTVGVAANKNQKQA